MSHHDEMTRIREGLERKHFEGETPSREKLDLLWDLADTLMDPAWGRYGHKQELEMLKNQYAKLVDLTRMA